MRDINHLSLHQWLRSAIPDILMDFDGFAMSTASGSGMDFPELLCDGYVGSNRFRGSTMMKLHRYTPSELGQSNKRIYNVNPACR